MKFSVKSGNNLRLRKMKKVIFTMTLIMFIATTYAEKYELDETALNIFRVLRGNNGNVEWLVKDSYDTKSFMFKGHKISAYYDDGKVVGFGERFNASEDLPHEILDSIEKKYQGYKIADLIIFIDYNGDIQYYIGINNNKKYKALKVSSNCKLIVMKEFHSNQFHSKL
jgi:hypothetical protein